MSKMQRAIGLICSNRNRLCRTFTYGCPSTPIRCWTSTASRSSATGCTLNDIVVLAVGRTIAQFPGVRSQIVGNEIVEFPHVNIGIAVGVDDGLVVPVLRASDTLSLALVAGETRRVVEKAATGGSKTWARVFTITNLGMFGIEEFAAIINPPESGILAVSRPAKPRLSRTAPCGRAAP